MRRYVKMKLTCLEMKQLRGPISVKSPTFNKLVQLFYNHSMNGNMYGNYVYNEHLKNYFPKLVTTLGEIVKTKLLNSII